MFEKKYGLFKTQCSSENLLRVSCFLSLPVNLRIHFSLSSVIVGVAMKVKRETVTGDTSTKNLKEAKKEKKLAVSLPLNRRAPKLHLQNRHGYGLLCILVPEIDTINLVIFLDNV